MHFENFIITRSFKIAKLNIEKKKKKQIKFSKLVGLSEKGKQTFFFF